MGYIKPSGRAALKAYKYAGRDLSLIYKHILTPMNNVLIEWIPLWMAPNLVTLSGVLIASVPYFVLQAYCPDLRSVGQLPAWIYLVDAFCTFAYQTLDNLDGKQARRTGSSSPLGLLFDHGCDAFNVTLGAINEACIISTGPTWKAVVLWQLVSVPFFFNTLEELHTGELVLPIVNGPTEGILFLCITKLFTIYAGAGWWEEPNVLFPAYQNNTCALIPLCGMACVFMLCNFWTIYKSPQRKTHIGTVLTQSALYLALNGAGMLWAVQSDVMAHYPRLFMWTAGLLFAKMAMHLMLAHLTHDDFSPLRRTFLVVGSIGTAAYGVAAVQGAGPTAALHVWTLLALAAVTLTSYAHFVVSVIRECCEILGIQCFRIPIKEA